MMKQVIFVGGKAARYSHYDSLVPGEVYTVLSETRWLSNIEYTIIGFYGRFDSEFFEDVLPTYFAVGDSVPVKGRPYRFRKVDIETHKIHEEYTEISTVNSVMCVGLNTYKANTHDSVYLVKVIK